MNNDHLREQPNEGHGPDEWLDRAIAKYTAAEPRTGLEARVLARLRSEKWTVSRDFRWSGMLAVAAALIVAVLIANSWHKVPTPEIAGTQRHLNGNSIRPEERRMKSPSRVPAAILKGRVARRKPQGMVPATVAIKSASSPRLETFPSTSPVTPEEKRLLSYVKRYPEKAALVARLQTELRRQTELEVSAPWPGYESSQTFDQQQR